MKNRIYLPLGLLLCICASAIGSESIDSIIKDIQKLEQNRDPKCYATASRLEDFMFGTPLTHEARFSKNTLQKAWVKQVWLKATAVATSNQESVIELKMLNQVLVDQLDFTQEPTGHWQVKLLENQQLKINKDDKRHYSTVAYGLRAILAVQQESLLDMDDNLLPLSSQALEKLKDSIDFLSLSVLKVTDTQARNNNQHEISAALLSDAWMSLSSVDLNKNNTKKQNSTGDETKVDLTVIHKIIQQKISSYAVYNDVANQLFVRNLQVYFARLSWPKDKQEAKQFKSLFTETMIQFAHDIYKESEAFALKNKHPTILESDVHQVIQKFIPHNINDYEDAIFFPKLSGKERVTIEAYDMDAFRDSGGHWRYLEYAITSPQFRAVLQPDPFALELIVENIAQFGVLSLRMAGEIGASAGGERLKTPYFIDALKLIQKRINSHSKVARIVVPEQTLVSTQSINNTAPLKENRFNDVTKNLGVDFMHRSSDWLNRLLRSYLKKGAGVGVITIPPAFGGSGIAAEDVNNDGYVDLLILSGVGNKLYLNQKGKEFLDVTKDSGLVWLRTEDNTPGEPRQPLIADLNNDGLQDIVITYVNDKHRVYQNMGNAKFKDVTDKANLGGMDLVGGPATVADFDGDGLLDLYVTYFGHYTKGILPTLKRRNDNGLPNQLFKNLGDFTFVNITKGSGTDHSGWTQAVGHTDFNDDGMQDIIVGNDFGVNAYLQNLGKGKFKNVASTLGTDKPSYTMNIGIADLNQDFLPDIYISNIVTMNKDEKYVLPSENTEMKFNADKLATMRVVEANDLFLSRRDPDGNVSYEPSDAVGRGYSSTGWSWDADFFDYDNDGDSDLYVLNGMNEFNLYSSENPYYEDPLNNQKKNVYIPVSTKESNVFFINEGGKLINHSEQSGVDVVGNSRSATYFDYDQDGDLDIAINNYHETAAVFENNLQANNGGWLKIKLIGNEALQVNRDAIGAKIILTTKNGGKVWREIHGSIGYMSVHPKQQHFGLGDQGVQSVEVIWPNQTKQVFSDFDVNAEYTITLGDKSKVNKVARP